MSGTSTTQGVLGASTSAAGIAVLPNTAGNTLLTIFSIVTIVVGGLVFGSFVVSRLAGKISR